MLPHRGVIGIVPAFQTGGPGSNSGRVRDFDFYPHAGCALCVLSCVVSGGGPNTLLRDARPCDPV